MTTDKQSANHAVIFSTPHQWEFDAARDALKRNDIPFYAQTENMGRMPTALAAPPSQAPGVAWSILVPESVWDRAQEVLREHRLNPEEKHVAKELSRGSGVSRLSSYATTIALIILLLVIIVWALATVR
jgi:hypothetical protein